ncbi:MAG: methyl-accepting chemotaxis protein [Candidatus Methanoperedens sp.]|nr:methyl-accepting chemotaxis protein [Candidatus Methanoperedens sp.]
MSIGKKIIGGYIIVLALLLIAVATGYYTINLVQDKYSGFIDINDRQMEDVKELNFIVESEVAEYRGFLLFPDESQLHLDALHEEYRMFNETADRLRKSISSGGGSLESISLLDDIVNLQANYEQGQKKVISISDEMNRTEAIAVTIKEVRPVRKELEVKISQFYDMQLKLDAQKRADVSTTSKNPLLVMIAVSIAALIAGLAIGFYITRSVTRQLRDRETERDHAEKRLSSASFYARGLIEASLDPLVTISKEGKITDVNKATEQVTGVNREHLVGSDFSDYFTEPENAREGYKQVFSKGFVKDYPLAIRNSSGKVTEVLYNAVVYKNEAGEVQGVFAAARDITENKKINERLKEQVHEIMEASNVLASSASEILATTTQLASTASETATAVSETSSTAEELKRTALLSSEKALSVSESAKKAASIAQPGKTAVGQTIEGMNRIKIQTDSVAQSIEKLSEKNQAIGEIITTVNDLAEQSNLLAVNAAIEAAKAGEQGKGFTVVAQEIKNLAEQSKHATAQVRLILSDIQKATGSAVMATEQVSKAVDAGVKQSNEAGESIVKLADSISEAAQAGTQIVASSQQQSVGINQIVSAMENIKQAAQQNEAGAKQAERAARDINELGQKLKAMVEERKI